MTEIILSKIFIILSNKTCLSRKEVAREIWKIVVDNNMDPAKLNCDEALKDLDLAEIEIDADTGESFVTYEQ